MKGSALVITYHVKNCKRVGGFHYFINYLEKLSFDIDWVTCPVSLSWIFHKNDKENLKNFIGLWRGITFEENKVTVRHFSEPVFVPAKIARIFGMELGYHYWPSWKNLRKRMKPKYDVILVEGVGCQYATEMRKDYPMAKIIYRPSDILETFLKIEDAQELERKMIKTADITVCVDENQLKYYEEITDGKQKLSILRNPLSTKEDIYYLRKRVPQKNSKKSVIYIGTSFADLNLIEYAASENQSADFMIIGPFKQKSHDNVKYLGTLSKEQYNTYMASANVGISPLLSQDKRIVYGYTRKIINYMCYLLPIVTTNSDNYLHVNGFSVAKSRDEFSHYIREALSYSVQDRLALKNGYIRVLEKFLDEKIESDFAKLVQRQ